ncbi:MAG: glycosyltransferase family 9 protein, partial [Nitrospira sp.]|nr:glycosyltransferase family 9 protein [Nitrospira sp.]
GHALGDWLGRGDVALCWMADQDGRLLAAIRGLGVERVVIRSPHSSDCKAMHQADRFLETVQGLAQATSDDAPLRLPDAALNEAEARLMEAGVGRERLLVALHPGSGSRQKCSDPSLFVEVIERLRSIGMASVLIGGPADGERLAEVAASCAIAPPVFQRLPLLSVAGLLAHANLFLGQDSGLTHLAGSLRLPTIALFGPTEIRRWAPRGGHVRALSGPPCMCQGQGWQAVQRCKDKPCLNVSPEAVFEACLQGLQLYRSFA